MEGGRADEAVPGLQLDVALHPPGRLLVLQRLFPDDLLLVGLKCRLRGADVRLRRVPVPTDRAAGDTALLRPQD